MRVDRSVLDCLFTVIQSKVVDSLEGEESSNVSGQFGAIKRTEVSGIRMQQALDAMREYEADKAMLTMLDKERLESLGDAAKGYLEIGFIQALCAYVIFINTNEQDMEAFHDGTAG